MSEMCGSIGERVETRNVSMYPNEWEAIDQAAERAGMVTAKGANTSGMLRQIVRGWMRDQGCDQTPAAPQQG
jgi:hypothetical protein